MAQTPKTRCLDLRPRDTPDRILREVTTEPIQTEEIHAHKERFANCLLSLPEAERAHWLTELINSIS